MASSSEVECRKQVQFYQSRYPTVPTMTSRELIQRRHAGAAENAENAENASDESLILIDVRTLPERQVSTIPGAISLDKFRTMNWIDNATDASTPTIIVTYCTIGYRSSMEARRLQEQMPASSSFQANIYSLDGILAYSHTGQPLISPHDGQETQQVHAFSSMWKPCANPDYDATMYTFPAVLGRLVQVGGHIVVRSSQHVAYKLSESSCCCCCCPGRGEGVVE